MSNQLSSNSSPGSNLSDASGLFATYSMIPHSGRRLLYPGDPVVVPSNTEIIDPALQDGPEAVAGQENSNRASLAAAGSSNVILPFPKPCPNATRSLINNPKGKNQYNSLSAALKEYHQLGIFDRESIAIKLLRDHGIDMSSRIVGRHCRTLVLFGSMITTRMTPDGYQKCYIHSHGCQLDSELCARPITFEPPLEQNQLGCR